MTLPDFLDLAELEAASRQTMDPARWAYLAGGAGSEAALRGNLSAFGARMICPRLAQENCASPQTSCMLFGRLLSQPVLLAPTSPQRLFHPQAELATALAARDAGTLSIVSTDSHYSLSEIGAAADGAWWFQLYAYRSRADIEATIRMASDAGAEALVVTMDAHFSARRLSAWRSGFRTPPDVDFALLRELGVLSGTTPSGGRMERLPLTWRDLEWIRGIATLPFLVKGVMQVEDARRCIEIGADGIIVSNHGGRQLDGVEPSLVALERAAAAVGKDCVVLMDGGVRSGVDVMKALALGARAVCIGRPYLWGLHLGGEAGVAAVLALVAEELRDAMCQAGAARLDDIDRTLVSAPAQLGVSDRYARKDEKAYG